MRNNVSARRNFAKYGRSLTQSSRSIETDDSVERTTTQERHAETELRIEESSSLPQPIRVEFKVKRHFQSRNPTACVQYQKLKNFSSKQAVKFRNSRILMHLDRMTTQRTI